MAIIARNRVVRTDQMLEEYPTPFRDYMGAQFDTGFAGNISTLLWDRKQLGDMQRGPQDPAVYNEFDFSVPQDQPMAPRMERELAEARIREAGVKLTVPDEGVSEAALNVLIRRQQDAMIRNDAINRSPAGMRSVAGFGAQLAATLLDPLNVASAFIPVVGQARYTAMLGRAASSSLARAGVRARVGALEGAVGAALIEPAVYGLHQSMQDEYTMADSLLNIGLGMALGAGLRTGGGALLDLSPGSAARRAAELDYPGRLDALNASVAQAATGRVVDIDALIRLNQGRMQEAAQAVVAGRAADIEAALADAPFATAAERTVAAQRVAEIASEEARRIVMEAVAAQERAVLASEVPAFLRTAEDLLALRDGAKTPEVSAQVARAVEIAQKPGFQRTQEERMALAEVLKGKAFGEQAAKSAKEAPATTDATSAPVAPDPNARSDGGNVARLQAADLTLEQARARAVLDLQDAARRGASPESVAIADFPAADAATQRLNAAPKDAGVQSAERELAEVMTKIEQLSKGADEAQAGKFREEMKPFDAAIKDADKLGDAARVAAVCGL
jgi:hypothetical protein